MDDLIRRSDVIEALKDNMVEMGGDDFSEMGVHSDDVDAVINGIPTIEPKRGEWIEFDTKWGRSLYYCTNCMETSEVPTAFGKPLYNFCPNCGADMKGADDE